jgi:predicted NACHT family NTPase
MNPDLKRLASIRASVLRRCAMAALWLAVMPAASVRAGERTDLPLPEGAVARLGAGRQRHGGSVCSVALSPDGKHALSGSDDFTLALWDAATGQRVRVFEGHAGTVWSVAFSPDGKQALSGSWDKTLALWDAATGKRVRVFEGHTGTVMSVAFSPDGKQALSGSAVNTLALWDAATGQRLRVFEGHTGRVLSVAFSPDGKQALSGSSDDTLALWDVASGKKVRVFQGHDNSVTSVAFSPDGKQALSGSWDDTVALWDIDTGQKIRDFIGHSGGVLSARFSAGGRRLISGSADNTALVWHPGLKQAEAARAWLENHKPEGDRAAALAAEAARLADQSLEARLEASERLIGAGDNAVAALLARYAPEPAQGENDSQTFAALLVRLDDDEYKVRVKAQEELGNFLPRVRAMAEEKVKDEAISAEVRNSLRTALARPSTQDMRDLGRVRAVLALIEMPESGAARAALGKYAEGPLSSYAASLARRAKAASQ